MSQYTIYFQFVLLVVYLSLGGALESYLIINFNAKTINDDTHSILLAFTRANTWNVIMMLVWGFLYGKPARQKVVKEVFGYLVPKAVNDWWTRQISLGKRRLFSPFQFHILYVLLTIKIDNHLGKIYFVLFNSLFYFLHFLIFDFFV